MNESIRRALPPSHIVASSQEQTQGDFQSLKDIEDIQGYFLQEISRISLLTREQELQLASRVQAGDADAWQQFVTSQPVEQMVKTLAQSDFAGIYLDRYGFSDQGSELESKLTYLLDSKPLVSANQRLAFFSLAAYKKKLPQDSASIESRRSRAGNSLGGR